MDRQAVQERFGIQGNSLAIRQVLDRVRMVAPSEITILIEGESGVGKELIAQALHGLSNRRHRPMVVVNCGAIPEGLIESELFGHEKGAYTGATDQRKGHFEEADNSTIFLDEIGELPLAAQVRLLRVLESGTFARVGSSKQIKVNTRIIAATNRDLGKEVQAGRFREDLYYRLSTVRLTVPPLRERREDILPIFENFLYRFGQQYNAPMKRLDEDAKALLAQYTWPGNLRELRNTAEQTTVLLRNTQVSAQDILPFLRGVTANGNPALAVVHHGANQDFNAAPELLYRLLLEMRVDMHDIKAAIQALATKEGVARYSSVPVSDAYMYDPPLKSVVSEAPLLPPAQTRPASLLPAYAPPPPNAAKEFHAPIEDVVSYDPHDLDEAQEVEETAVSLSLSGKKLPSMQEMEEALIREGLARYKGNRRKTAKALGISERTLYRKIHELGLDHEALAEDDWP